MTEKKCPYCRAVLVWARDWSKQLSEPDYGLCTKCRLDATNE